MIAVTVDGIQHAAQSVGPESWGTASDLSDTKIAAHVLCCDTTRYVGTHDVYGPRPDPANLCAGCLDVVGARLQRESELRQLQAEGKPISWFHAVNQGTWWKTREGVWVRIEDMTTSHAGNTARFLHRGAEHLHHKYVMQSIIMTSGDGGDQAMLSLDESQRRLEEMDPTAWLESTELYKALLARAGEL